MTDVVKRDGRVVPFDSHKISSAIGGAAKEVGVDMNYNSNLIAEEICNKVVDNSSITVDEIQDIVEQKLMEHGFYDVAKAYIRYRYVHELARQKEKQEVYNGKIQEKLMAANVQNQNANVDEHSFGGRMGEMASEVSRQFALDYCMSKMARNNHLNNEIYIHDLDHYALGDHNCLSIPFDKLLAEGFSTRQTDVRPANSVNTAFQLVAVIFQLQSLMQFG